MVRDEAPSILYQHKDKQYIIRDISKVMNAEERDLIRALPNRLLGIIFGIIMIVNAGPFGKAAPEEIQDIVTTNLNLLGYLIIVMSFLRIAIDYWLKLTPESKD
ncbi:MAG TPA: hypothetical protein EYQ70_03630 [Marine Group III euryarchaeote]|uniref:Uncharacterized protein n=1 Tax=Marine Group III euryarchaeote TaxID=2173149 RepID=A0A7J4GS65_9ARCH|nr:hypothetical protein [Marine Group III euryarchaeote]